MSGPSPCCRLDGPTSPCWMFAVGNHRPSPSNGRFFELGWRRMGEILPYPHVGSLRHVAEGGDRKRKALATKMAWAKENIQLGNAHENDLHVNRPVLQWTWCASHWVVLGWVLRQQGPCSSRPLVALLPEPADEYKALWKSQESWECLGRGPLEDKGGRSSRGEAGPFSALER